MSEKAPSVAGRWASLMARRRRLVLLVSGLLFVAGGASYGPLQHRLAAPVFGVAGSESWRADRLITAAFPDQGDEQELLVFSSERTTFDSEEYRIAVSRAVELVRGFAEVRGVTDPSTNEQQLVSPDRHVALAPVALDGSAAERARAVRSIQSDLARRTGADVQVAITGYSAIWNDLIDVTTEDLGRAEAIGVPIALLLLVLALRALAAAGIGFGVALSGIVFSFAVLLGASYLMTLDSLALSMAIMIGLGIGIDYAMFIVSRFQEELARRGIRDRHDRAQIDDAVAAAMDTAGTTVLTSGVVVTLSLSALAIVSVPVFRSIAVSVATAALSMLAAALVLLPAALSLVGPAVNRGTLPARLRRTREGEGWQRWTNAVMSRPVLLGVLAAAMLTVAATPIGGLQFGVNLSTDALVDRPAGQALATLGRSFGPGVLAPIEITATGPGGGSLDAVGSARTDDLAGWLATTGRVADIVSHTADGRRLITVIPQVPFDSPDAAQLVRDIRAQITTIRADGGPDMLVGGAAAEFVDLSDEVSDKVPLVVVLVLGASMLLLIVAFRSLVLPIKAITMNLLATTAAIGITVVVFQWGFGERAFNFQSTGALQVFLPITVFVVVFGLSMDYEVFLIRRIKEEWDSGHDNQHAVAVGLQRTARSITSAAAVMIVIFLSFVTANVLELKQIGFALAVAIAIDAVLVRLVLVPAMMRLFGRWNWWLPGGHHADVRPVEAVT